MTTVDDIREQLRQLGLDTRGNKSAIKARLRKHLKKDPSQSQSSETSGQAKAQGAEGDGSVDSDSEETRIIEKEKDTTKEQTVDLSDPPRKTLHMNSRYDYYLCFDVEATCEKGFSFEFPNEVIEFPVVLLDGSTFEVVRIMPTAALLSGTSERCICPGPNTFSYLACSSLFHLLARSMNSIRMSNPRTDLSSATFASN